MATTVVTTMATAGTAASTASTPSTATTSAVTAALAATLTPAFRTRATAGLLRFGIHTVEVRLVVVFELGAAFDDRSRLAVSNWFGLRSRRSRSALASSRRR